MAGVDTKQWLYALLTVLLTVARLAEAVRPDIWWITVIAETLDLAQALLEQHLHPD